MSPAHAQARIRPTGVSIVSLLVIAVGFIDFAVLLLSIAFADIPIPWANVDLIFRFGGMLDIVLYFALSVSGVLSFTLAFGLWNGYHWAWKWTLLSSILSIAASVATILLGIGAIGIVINIIIIVYLLKPQTRNYFRR